MNPPKEVDGWRIASDPAFPSIYWRMWAFELEWNCWLGADWLYHEWRQCSPEVPRTTARLALWAELFLAP